MSFVGVERRRIYDIVNILESVGVIMCNLSNTSLFDVCVFFKVFVVVWFNYLRDLFLLFSVSGFDEKGQESVLLERF